MLIDKILLFKSGWSRRDHPNLKFLWYEDMKVDLVPVIRDMCAFTGRHLTEYKILLLDDALYVDNFRQADEDFSLVIINELLH